MKTEYFSENIAACDLKVGNWRHFLALMNVSIEGQGHLFDLGQRLLTYKNKNLLFSRTIGSFVSKVIC